MLSSLRMTLLCPTRRYSTLPYYALLYSTLPPYHPHSTAPYTILPQNTPPSPFLDWWHSDGAAVLCWCRSAENVCGQTYTCNTKIIPQWLLKKWGSEERQERDSCLRRSLCLSADLCSHTRHGSKNKRTEGLGAIASGRPILAER